MAKIQPSTRSFSAGSVFLPGGSITFGQPGIVPDPDNPATLKAVYLDEAQTQIAQNPQPLDSNASFQQTSDGILCGTGTYSVVWKNAADVEVYRNLSYEFVDDLGSAAFVDTGTASDEVPLNSDLGTASTRDTGTGVGQVPLNSDLGTASTRDIGAGVSQVPLNSDLLDVLRDSDVGQTVAGLTSPGATNLDSGSLPEATDTEIDNGTVTSKRQISPSDIKRGVEAHSDSIGRSWTDKTSSRSDGTQYTNSGLSFIQIGVIVDYTGNQSPELLVDSLSIATLNAGGSTRVFREVLTAIIPPSGTYQINSNGATIFKWCELE